MNEFCPSVPKAPDKYFCFQEIDLQGGNFRSFFVHHPKVLHVWKQSEHFHTEPLLEDEVSRWEERAGYIVKYFVYNVLWPLQGGLRDTTCCTIAQVGAT